jgi:uncharacterized protein YgiM (DUF1202 family)
MNKLFWTGLLAAAVFAVVAEEPATVNRNHVNVRGAPSVNAEVVTRLQKGAKVTFLEEISVSKPKKDEPDRWAAIKLPEGAKAWVFIPFLADNKVKAPRLNVRAGPGENYSVLARLERGAEVKEIRQMGDWMEIEPPDNARGYVDATFIDRASVGAGQEIAEAAKPPLEQKPIVYEPPTGRASVPASPATATPTVTNTPPPTVAETPTVVTPPPVITTPSTNPPTVITEAPTVAIETPKEEPKPEIKPAQPEPTPTPAIITRPAGEVAGPGPNQPLGNQGPADSDTPKRVLPPVGPAVVTPNTIAVTEKRIVRREGEVRSTKFNIQAPTFFELVGERGTKLNYLSGEKAGFKLKDYKGLRVVVTGEESIDQRYPDRPVLELETIEVAP